MEVVGEALVVDEPFLALRQAFGDLLRQALLPGHELGVAAEQDVRAAAGHVRGDGHGAQASGLGDDLRFHGVVLRVEHDVLDAAPLQQRRELLRLLDRDRADQDRPPRLLLLDDVEDDRFPLLPLGAVHRVGLLLARSMGRLVGTTTTSSL